MFKNMRQNQCDPCNNNSSTQLVLKNGVRHGSGFPVTGEAHIYTQ